MAPVQHGRRKGTSRAEEGALLLLYKDIEQTALNGHAAETPRVAWGPYIVIHSVSNILGIGTLVPLTCTCPLAMHCLLRLVVHTPASMLVGKQNIFVRDQLSCITVS